MGLFDSLFKPGVLKGKRKPKSYLRNIATGTLFRFSDFRIETSYQDIKTQIDCMRSLAEDSQVATALGFYATDSTITNSQGQIIWATPIDDSSKDCADIINACFKRWEINSYAREHILELATIGNLYIPTTRLFSEQGSGYAQKQIGLDSNTLADEAFDIVPSYKIAPENVLHIWRQGRKEGFIYQPEDDFKSRAQILLYPESSIIHFSLGGLLGDYTIDALDTDGSEIQYDIQFAKPLMKDALLPTQTLSLLEDSVLLASLIRVVKFINVDCGIGAEEDEIRDAINDVKAAIEQQLSLHTETGDIQSFVNPQSPNNLVYIPKVGGQDAISVTDLNMAEATAEDSKLIEHFQNKKLSVLGVPKEAMNYSSNEGLGGAGSVLSQRSSLYADSLGRIKSAYISGWTQAFNKYFVERGYSGFENKFQLHMQPIITQQSTITFEKRDAAISQATAIVDLMTNLGVDNPDAYREAITEILLEVLPKMGTEISGWNMDPKSEDGNEF